ncbi:MAG TPA: IPT/TIG domain-containing protein [Acidimicrobiales bacterium]
MAPRIERLSQHQRNAGDTGDIFIYGDGFRTVTAVWFGEQQAPSYRVDGETVITVTPPDVPPGEPVWVIVQTDEDGYSECEGDAQVFTVLSSDAPAVGGDLLLDSVTPEEVTIGREETYWLTGSGLSGVTGVMLASSACQFESYDDTRLMFTTPAEIRDVKRDEGNTLAVFGSNGQSKELTIVCRSVPEQSENSTWFPSINGADPAEVGTEGGYILTLQGDSLNGVTEVYLGDIQLADVQVISATQVQATVPPLDGYEGRQLMPFVVAGDTGSPDTSVTVRVKQG